MCHNCLRKYKQEVTAGWNCFSVFWSCLVSLSNECKGFPAYTGFWIHLTDIVWHFLSVRFSYTTSLTRRGFCARFVSSQSHWYSHCMKCRKFRRKCPNAPGQTRQQFRNSWFRATRFILDSKRTRRSRPNWRELALGWGSVHISNGFMRFSVFEKQ
jgi:hypothetical protein